MDPSNADKALDFVTARRRAGLSDETMRILLFLRKEPQRKREAIAEVCKINSATIPRYLSHLVASGHLVRSSSSSDGREVLFALSERGVKLVDSLLKHFSCTPS